MIIKIVLISGIIGAAVFALRGSNTGANQAIRRLAGLTFVAGAGCAVLFPDAVTWLANRLNVGRGTDLVLYGLVVAFLYTVIALYQRIHMLEHRLIQVARALALNEAVTETSPGDEKGIE